METLTVTRPLPHIVLVTFCRPSKLNSMSLKFFTELKQTFVNLQSDSDVRAVVISAEGKAFSSGLDCKG